MGRDADFWTVGPPPELVAVRHHWTQRAPVCTETCYNSFHFQIQQIPYFEPDLRLLKVSVLFRFELLSISCADKSGSCPATRVVGETKGNVCCKDYCVLHRVKKIVKRQCFASHVS